MGSFRKRMFCGAWVFVVCVVWSGVWGRVGAVDIAGIPDLPETVDLGKGFTFDNTAHNGKVFFNPHPGAANMKSLLPDAAPYCFERVAAIRKVVRAAKEERVPAVWPDGPELSLAGCYLANLPAEVGALSNLESLILPANQLKDLPIDLANLAKLKTLVLHDNQLTTIPEVIPLMPKLETLVLSHNNIAMLHPAISEVSTLKVFIASNNTLRSLPKAFSSLKNLQVLNLANNSFSVLPKLVCKLPSISEIDLSGNALRSLPKCIGDAWANRLLWMPLQFNALSDLPASFAKFTSLTTLNLQENRFSHVPPVLEALAAAGSRLHTLNMQSNFVSELPEFLTDFAETLAYLDVSENILTEVPSWIGSLLQLYHLDLALNELASVPQSIENLAALALDHLDLFGNPIAALPEPWCQASSHPMHAFVREDCLDIEEGIMGPPDEFVRRTL